jgi:hypothetical protein
MSKIN